MERVFLHMLGMSITAGLLAIAVLLLRPLLKKAPKALCCVLWGFVAIRLICPVSFTSPFSLIPKNLTVSDSAFSGSDAGYGDFVSMTQFSDTTGFLSRPSENGNIRPIQLSQLQFSETDSFYGENTESFYGDATQSVPPVTPGTTGAELLRGFLRFICTVWPIGILGMLCYAGYSYLRIRKKVKEAVFLTDNIWLCDHVESPFILGIFRPRILLPSTIQPEEMQHVIAHEKAHLKRLDHLWKPLGFVLLSVYWFNPVLWIAYIFLCKDIELACDERVIRKMDTEDIKSYSSTLLNFSISRKAISVCPLAFGEVHVKKRIKNALHYKKPAFWIIMVAVLSCVVVAVCFLTNPVAQEKNPPVSEEDIAFVAFDVIGTGTDFPSIEIKAEPYSCYFGDNPDSFPLQVTWNNYNYDSDFLYGLDFDILYYEDETWTSCSTESVSFPEITCSLPRRSAANQSYSLERFDFSRNGRYRFQAEPQPGQYIWFDFDTFLVQKSRPDTLTDYALLSLAHTITKNHGDINQGITEYPELYDLLLSGGERTVNCFVKALSGVKENGLREYLMAKVCSVITGIGNEEGAYNPATWWATADQWLEIYKKHLAHENTQSVSLFSDKNTPTTRTLVWLNWFYNYYNYGEDAKEEIQISLPDFPGVTLFADSQKIEAYSAQKGETLISSSTIWDTYLTDLNGDGSPEICATVSLGDDGSHLGIRVYDYKNSTSYSLWDEERYDYALSGTVDTMFVKKYDRTGEEDIVVGDLILSVKGTDISLTLEEADPSDYSSIWLNDVHMDLASYNYLYNDVAQDYSRNRWSRFDICPIWTIDTEEDWNKFVAAFPDVRLWSNHSVCSVDECFSESILDYIANCGKYEYADIYLTPHGLAYGGTGTNSNRLNYSPRLTAHREAYQ